MHYTEGGYNMEFSLQGGSLVFKMVDTSIEVTVFGVTKKHVKADVVDVIVTEAYNYNREHCSALLELLHKEEVDGMSSDLFDAIRMSATSKILDRLSSYNVRDIIKILCKIGDEYSLCKSIVDNTDMKTPRKSYENIGDLLDEVIGEDTDEKIGDVIKRKLLNVIGEIPPALFESGEIMYKACDLLKAMSIGVDKNANTNN